MSWLADRNITQHSLNRIHRAWIEGSRHQAKALARRHLNHPAVKQDAAHRVLCTYQDGRIVEAAAEQVQQLAAGIDLFHPCATPILWWPKRKRSGGLRPVCSLPNVWRASLKIIHDVLLVTLQPGPHLIAIRRRGRDYVAPRIKAALEQGYEWCFVGDLRSCFESVNTRALNLPLPNSVIKSMLDTASMSFVRTPSGNPSSRFTHGDSTTALYGNRTSVYSDIAPMRTDPRGLVTGSPTSNLVLSWLFNDMPEVLPHSCPAFLYSDNSLVLTRSEQDCRLIENTLSEYFSEHPAGPFALGARQVMAASEGFEYLGYHFKKRASGEVRIEMSTRHAEEAFIKVISALQEDRREGSLYPGLVEEYLTSKLSGFAAITDCSDFLEGQLETACLVLSEDSSALDELIADWFFRHYPRLSSFELCRRVDHVLG